MPELQSEELDTNTPITELDQADPVGGNAKATGYFEDLLFKFRADLQAINTELLTDAGIYSGTGSPEGVLVAGVGSTYQRADGGAGTSFYVKEAGPGLNTGWVAK